MMDTNIKRVRKRENNDIIKRKVRFKGNNKKRKRYIKRERRILKSK